MKNSGGYVKTFRSIGEWEWYLEVNTFRVFFHLLISVNYQAKKWHGITIRPGQVVTSRKKLASELRLSERNVRTALKNLQKTGEITVQTTNRYSIITICNWGTYQGGNDDQRPTGDQQSDQLPDQQMTSKVTSGLGIQRNCKTNLYGNFQNESDQQPDQQMTSKVTSKVTTTKEIKNKENIYMRNSNCANEFEKFWKLYDKKIDRKKCLQKWQRLSESDKEKIFETLPAYIQSTPDKKYRKNPLTYLTGEVWNDPDLIPTRKPTRPKFNENYVNINELE